MAVFSKELCRQRLKIWLAAEEAIATGPRSSRIRCSLPPAPSLRRRASIPEPGRRRQRPGPENSFTGQRYQIEGRSLTRADLYDVRKELEYWAGKLAEAESEEQNGGYIRAYHFVPRDI